MKNEMKKKNNKGFSLVELIVVVAIMAVLMVVLAPAMLRYVEKTRIQKDETAVSEVKNAVELALADETVAKSIPVAGTTVTVATGSITGGTDALLDEVKITTPPSKIDISSKKYTSKSYTITISGNAETGFTVTGSWPADTP